MKVVVLSFCDAMDIHLIRRLKLVLPTLEVVQIVASKPQGTRAPLWSKLSFRKLARRIENAVTDARAERLRKDVSQILLGVSDAPEFAVAAHVCSVDINTPETAMLLTKLAPDVLLVSGAPILKDAVFSVPKLATVNIHYGVAPQYRGENTLFWPLYFEDYQQIGVTLHHIDRRIDGGRILAVGRPALSPDDTEATLFAKCARLAGDLALDLVNAAQRGAPLAGITQTDNGRLFLRRHRRIWHDARYRWARVRRELPSTTEHVTRHF